MVGSWNPPDWDVHSYPGAKTVHLIRLFENYKGPLPKSVIINIALNDKESNLKTTKDNLADLFNVTTRIFKDIKVHFVQQSFSKTLVKKHKDNLCGINQFIKDNAPSFIPTLPNKDFRISYGDTFNIHWSEETAISMVKQWTSYLNL